MAASSRAATCDLGARRTYPVRAIPSTRRALHAARRVNAVLEGEEPRLNCAIVRRMIFRRLGVAAAFGALVCTAMPACSATANVSDVWMSLDEDGARRRNVFYTDSATITCVAELGIGRKDVTIEMLIRQIRGAEIGTDEFVPVNKVVAASELRPEITKDKPGLATLTLSPPSVDEEGNVKEDQEAPFEPGSFVCEVMLDGKLEGRAAFNIDYPPCPTKVILPGTPCFGFYTLGTECPASGATGEPDPTCTCEAGGWKC